MDGSAARARCGRLVYAMTRCECAETPFEELVRRMRDGGADFDAVQTETGAGLLCSACLPDLREHVEAAGFAPPAPTHSSCVPLEELSGVGEGDAEAFAPRLAAAREPR